MDHRHPALDAALTEPLARMALALLDEIACGLIVCDARGRIRYANRAAQDELASAQWLQRVGDGFSRAQGAGGELEPALRAAALQGRRTLVRLSRADDNLLASVLPLHAASTDCPLVLVMLGRRWPCSELGLDMLARSYGLTQAECRVLSALMREATPRQIAAEHDVAVSTVRTQITSLRTKFGVRRIEGLLLQLAAAPPLAHALRVEFGALPVLAEAALAA